MSPDNENPVQFARRLYDNVYGWYQSADTKAQVVLAIDGGFLTFLTGAIFAKPSDLKAVVGSFSNWTSALLVLMTFCLVASIMSAMYCLRSRTYTAAQLRQFVEIVPAENGNSTPYPPKVMLFFQMVAVLEETRFCGTLKAINGSFEIEALASQIQILSRNVQKKHRAVNAGFVLAATTLILFLFSGLSYLVDAWS